MPLSLLKLKHTLHEKHGLIRGLDGQQLVKKVEN
jgi:hypothetical protein